MESYKIDELLQKYFEGETTTAEEAQIKKYFASDEVAPDHEQYKPLFGFYIEEQKHIFEHVTALPQKRHNNRNNWLAIAASVAIFAGLGFYFNQPAASPQELGTYEDPEVAFRETQKALNLLSGHVNTGVQSVQYIEEFDEAKDKVFIK
ncbi:MAG TPA: hypothetical protein VF581_10130 [Flavobacterium sp.]|jgi:hypothetical protein